MDSKICLCSSGSLLKRRNNLASLSSADKCAYLQNATIYSDKKVMWSPHLGSFSAVFLYSSKAVGFGGGSGLTLLALGPFGSFLPFSCEESACIIRFIYQIQPFPAFVSSFGVHQSAIETVGPCSVP
jgi:hypothetical protein